MFQRAFTLALLAIICAACAIDAHPRDAATPPAMNLPVIENLPDPFAMPNGNRVQNAADWRLQRERIKTQDDWRAMLDFADLQLRGRATTTGFDGLENVEPAFDWRAP